MAVRFTADPATLDQEGGKITTIGEQFNDNVEKVYSTIDTMIESDYLSPEAKEIAERIKEKKQKLDEMTKTINQYGEYAKNTATDVINNQEEISSEAVKL